jgi:hypothetical protein
VKPRKLGNDVCTVILSHLYESNLDVLLFIGLLEERRLFFSSLQRKKFRRVLCTINRKMHLLRIICRFIFLCTHLNFQLLLLAVNHATLSSNFLDKDMKGIGTTGEQLYY